VSLNTESLEPVTDDDILIVYGHHQARLYPEFNRDNVYSVYGFGPFANLRSRQPKRVFYTQLGLSREADRLRRLLAELGSKYGTTSHPISELYPSDEPEAAGA
jgi:hypothetical protein